jgi:single-strand DNA-binding protein
MPGKLIGYGNLTRDVELRYVGNDNTAVLDMGVAVSNGYGDKEEVAFLDVTVWGKVAENCAKYLHKGSKIYLEARPKTDSWEKDGQKRSKVVFTADTIRFLDGVKKDDTVAAEVAAEDTTVASVPVGDDVPF